MKYKRSFIETKYVEVSHDELNEGNWEIVRVSTTIALKGFREFPKTEVIWDKLDEKVYIREDGWIMYYAPMERCTFMRKETERFEAEVREYPK